MGNRGPHRDRGQPLFDGEVGEHPDDPRGALIIGGADPEIGLDVRGVARAVHGDRPRVRGIGEQRAHADDEFRVVPARRADDLIAVRAPTQRRLDPLHEHHPAPLRGAGYGDGRIRPFQVPHALLVDHRNRAVHLEIVVILRIESIHRIGVPLLGEQLHGRGRRGAGIVPAIECRDEDGGQVGCALRVTHNSSLTATYETMNAPWIKFLPPSVRRRFPTPWPVPPPPSPRPCCGIWTARSSTPNPNGSPRRSPSPSGTGERGPKRWATSSSAWPYPNRSGSSGTSRRFLRHRNNSSSS